MKKRYLALLLIFVTATAFGQSNFYRLSAGLGGGGSYSYTDVEKGAFSYAAALNLDYYFTPFITAGLEVQSGVLKGGGKSGEADKNGRMFTNNFMAVNANLKFRAGEITDFYYNDFLNYTKGFYIGTGLGMINNKMSDNIREKPYLDSNGNPIIENGKVKMYQFPGSDKSTNFYIPLNVGIDFYFPDGWGDIRYVLNVNYQTNVTFGEGLDGYDDTLTIRKQLGSFPDIYNVLSVGFKYTFGPKGLSSKTIR